MGFENPERLDGKGPGPSSLTCLQVDLGCTPTREADGGGALVSLRSARLGTDKQARSPATGCTLPRRLVLQAKIGVPAPRTVPSPGTVPSPRGPTPERTGPPPGARCTVPQMHIVAVGAWDESAWGQATDCCGVSGGPQAAKPAPAGPDAPPRGGKPHPAEGSPAPASHSPWSGSQLSPLAERSLEPEAVDSSGGGRGCAGKQAQG